MTAAAIAQWRDRCLASGQAGLRSREADARALAISRMKAEIGEIPMENELLRERARRAEAQHPFVVAEAEAVAPTVSPSAGRRYAMALGCRVLELPRSTVYAAKQRIMSRLPAAQKRGPKTAWSDPHLTELTRGVLATSPWLGEGSRKVWAQLRAQEIRTSKGRVLRLMPGAGLLAPTRSGHAHGPEAHDGTIATQLPDRMWGTEATSTLTGEGQGTIVIGVDPCTQECVGIHAALRGTPIEALEPIRQGLRERFGAHRDGVRSGLVLRHDNGRQYGSHYFQGELAFLGIESIPAYVREPEGNGVAERFIRTLKEQLLLVQHFETVDERQQALQSFKQQYNHRWPVSKHDYLASTEARARLKLKPAA